MNIFNKRIYLILSGILYLQSGFSQNSISGAIPLNNLDAFQDPGKNWLIASDASAEFSKVGPIKTANGSGIIADISTEKSANLTTKEAFGDLDLNLDFMLSKGATSAVYLQGRYEVQLADSWTKLNPTFGDLGGIGQERENQSGFNGSAPLMNVARAPGLWQHLHLKFRAPKFDAGGIKIANAYFEEIYLNEVLVQTHLEIRSPTQGSIFSDEKTTGPLILQGNGPSVAFRNIIPAAFPESVAQAILPSPVTGRRLIRVVNPVILNAESGTNTFRSFMNFGSEKRTNVVSVGSPNQTNYSYDVKQGALFQIWRGRFLDVTNMWNARGETQLAIPLGSVISLSAAPSFATLADENALWPDSIAFEDMHNKGYTLDKDRIPTFSYQIAGYSVSDKTSPQENGESLRRELIVTNAPKDLYFKIASAKAIESLGKGLYVVGDRSYYIQLNERLKASVRKTQNGQDLIVPVSNTTSPLIYSIIW